MTKKNEKYNLFKGEDICSLVVIRGAKLRWNTYRQGFQGSGSGALSPSCAIHSKSYTTMRKMDIYDVCLRNTINVYIG